MSLDEPDETFTVSLGTPVNAVVGDASAVVTITDDDPAPVLAIGDVSVARRQRRQHRRRLHRDAVGGVGEDRHGRLRHRQRHCDRPAPTIRPRQASSPSRPGVTTRTVTVAVLGDVVAEGDETFSVTLNTHHQRRAR